MRVLFDHQIFSAQIYGGISRYFSELMKGFSFDEEIDCDLSLRYTSNYYLRTRQRIPDGLILKNLSFRGKHKILNYFNKKISKRKILKQNYDIFHPTYYDPYFLDFIDKKPFVLTIYDMIHEIFPDSSSGGEVVLANKKMIAEKASVIIAISKNTKKDIVRFFGIDEDKIKVIYLASSCKPNVCDESLNLSLPENYVFFIGKRNGYKNFDLFVESMALIMKKDSSLNIVCAGGGVFTKAEKEKFRDFDIESRISHFFGGDNLIQHLYSKALAFVFPSLYEGFGIPILEAFSCNCPVICSRTSSLPEIAKDSAIYFNPEDKTEMRNSIEEVLYDKTLRERLVELGVERLKDFSWANTARQTKKIYKEII
jgi:glycosyltransferase involved in cell wall biosynthesis